jgi:hypothetical protein
MIVTLVAAAAVAAQGDVVEVGRTPSFRAVNLSGQAVSSEALKGRATLLILWGTWSAQSARALEIGQKMSDRFGARLRVVALGSWDTLENVRAFADSNKHLKNDFWCDPAGKNPAESIAVKVFGARRFPSVVVLDKSGRTVGGMIGYKPSDDIVPLIEKAI